MKIRMDGGSLVITPGNPGDEATFLRFYELANGGRTVTVGIYEEKRPSIHISLAVDTDTAWAAQSPETFSATSAVPAQPVTPDLSGSPMIAGEISTLELLHRILDLLHRTESISHQKRAALRAALEVFDADPEVLG